MMLKRLMHRESHRKNISTGRAGLTPAVRSALQIFQELCQAYVQRGSDIYVVHIRTKLMHQFERVGIDNLVSGKPGP